MSAQTESRPSVTGHSPTWLERLWSSIADRGRDYANVPAASLPPGERARQLADSLLSGRGEASGAALARELVVALKSLPSEGRLAFCRTIAAGFTPDEDALRAAVEAWLADPTPARAAALSDAAEAPRQELLRRMNQAQGGTAELVALRAEILGVLRTDKELAPLDSDLRHLFASWFNRGSVSYTHLDVYKRQG